MKTIKYILIAITMFLAYSCTRVPEHFLLEEKVNYYYPHKDTFSLGDTLYINLSIPKVFTSECGTKIFETDSVLCNIIDFDINAKNEDDMFNQYWCENFKKVKFIKGSRDNKCMMYFVYNREKERYENEFYYVLQDTGKLFFGESTGRVRMWIKNSEVYYRGWFGIKYQSKEADYWSSFKETNQGGFYVYVKP